MKDENGLTNYMVRGMMIGLFVGTIISIFFSESTFISIAGGGFGLGLGMIVSIVIWGLKEKE